MLDPVILILRSSATRIRRALIQGWCKALAAVGRSCAGLAAGGPNNGGRTTGPCDVTGPVEVTGYRADVQPMNTWLDRLMVTSTG